MKKAREMRGRVIRKNSTWGLLIFIGLLILAACGDATPTETAAVPSKAASNPAEVGPSARGNEAAATIVSGSNPAGPCPDPVPAPSKPSTADPARNGTEKPATLRIGLVPNQNPDSLKQQYSSFKAYMESQLAQPVELFVANDYAGVVQAMVGDKLDIAYFGGLTYVQAREQVDVYPIVTEIDRFSKNSTYCSAIIVPAGSPAKTIQDLKGKIFAFGDISSTSGSLFPRIMLDQAGIKLTDFKEIKYTGGHDATALAIQNGAVDGGGIEERILLRLVDQGKVDKSKYRVIQRSAVPGYPWVARAKLDSTLVDKITGIFLNIKDPDLLSLLRAEGYVKVKDADYEYVREQALKLGLLTAKKG